MAVAIETNQNYGNSNEMVTQHKSVWEQKNHILGFLAHKKKKTYKKTLKN